MVKSWMKLLALSALLIVVGVYGFSSIDGREIASHGFGGFILMIILLMICTAPIVLGIAIGCKALTVAWYSSKLLRSMNLSSRIIAWFKKDGL